jgi:hypothetical protein
MDIKLELLLEALWMLRKRKYVLVVYSVQEKGG